MKTGIANLPLHYGTVPGWLFERMELLAGEISRVIIEEYGQKELLARLSHPFWFQSFACVLGFDWHSSGTTTTTCGALKEGLLHHPELGIFVAGGKGKTSRKAPSEIEMIGDRLSISQTPNLIYASKMSAKVDNAALQDGFQLYHHCFIFTNQGDWAVVQQGMSDLKKQARRYHWLSESVKDFVNEPHTGICSDLKQKQVLDLTAQQSKKTRQIESDLVKDGKVIFKDLKKLARFAESRRADKQLTLNLPNHHSILKTDFKSKYLWKTLQLAHEKQPENFERLLSLKGVGPNTIRALTLVAELIYGAKPSYTDPARYSFAHGGKDGYPFPVDRITYDQSIEVLKQAVNKAKINHSEKLSALKRLAKIAS